jgi:hypothetical protein
VTQDATALAPPARPAPRLDPDDVATALRVLAAVPSLETDDPDFETLKRAASLMYKRLKKDRRND